MTYTITLYRKLPDYGWHIVGRDAATSHDSEYYVKEYISSCRRGHNSPISVESNLCVKCVQLGHHNAAIGEVLVLDLDPTQPVDKAPIRAYWRKKLCLPDITESDRFANVFVVENKVYHGMQAALKALKITTPTLRKRVDSTKYEWRDWIALPVPGLNPKFDYNIDGVAYKTQAQVTRATGVYQAVVSMRCASPLWPTWIKRAI